MGIVFETILLDFCMLPFILVIIVIVHYMDAFSYWKRKKIPHLSGSFPYGSVSSLAESRINFGEAFAEIYKSARFMQEKLIGFYVFTKPLILLADLSLIKNVLTTDFNYFQGRGIYYNEKIDPLSGHLVNLTGEKWRRIRKKVTPTFSSGKMKLMLRILIKCSLEVEKVVDESVKLQEPIDTKDILEKLTIDNIGSCVFGLNCNSFQNPDAEFRTYGKMFFDSTMSNGMKILAAMRFQKLMEILKVRTIKKEVSDFFMNAFKETIEYREQSQTQRNDFIDLFIRIKNNENINDEYENQETETKLVNDDEQLTFNELVAQAFVFFMAGFETSATTMNYCLFELAQNQDVQEKLRAEILEVLGKHDGDITYESLKEMKYLTKVVNETLRKYPPIPVLRRECNKDYNIPETDITVEKGTTVWISVLGIHNDPILFEHPEKFNPDRFNDEGKINGNPLSYMPFGDGPRNCIGLRFGYLQVKIGLIALLKRFSYTVDEKTILPAKFATRGIFLSPKNNIYLRAHKIV